MNKLKLDKASVGTLIKEYLLITLGLSMYALGWAMFLTPNGMIGGGVTGFAAIVQYATQGAIPISVTFFLLNILLLIIGTKILGGDMTEISYFSTDGNIKDAMVSYWDAYSFTAYWHPKWFLEPFFQNEVNKGIISQNPGY